MLKSKYKYVVTKLITFAPKMFNPDLLFEPSSTVQYITRCINCIQNASIIQKMSQSKRFNPKG